MIQPHDEIRPIDILYILDNPWKVSEGEWELEGKSKQDTILSTVLRLLNLTVAGGYSKIWRAQNNLPIAILGAHKVMDKKYETFFIASKHMDEHALKISIEMRRILKDLSSHYPGCTCGLYSTSDHPNQIRWFKFLGFTYEPKGNIGNTRYFEYIYTAI